MACLPAGAVEGRGSSGGAILRLPHKVVGAAHLLHELSSQNLGSLQTLGLLLSTPPVDADQIHCDLGGKKNSSTAVIIFCCAVSHVAKMWQHMIYAR